MATATGVRKIGERVERKDLWWVEPLLYVVILGGFILYATWASLVNGNYYADYMNGLLRPTASWLDCSRASAPGGASTSRRPCARRRRMSSARR